MALDGLHGYADGQAKRGRSPQKSPAFRRPIGYCCAAADRCPGCRGPEYAVQERVWLVEGAYRPRRSYLPEALFALLFVLLVITALYVK